MPKMRPKGTEKWNREKYAHNIERETAHFDHLTSPEVGSSRNKIDGMAINSRPIFTRLRSPPDTPRRLTSPTMLSATLDNPKLAIVMFAKSFISSVVIIPKKTGNESTTI